ncbi:MAG: antitoxin VapB family protein [Candidatus Thermoplasmatota archaeon]|jgi:predicted CopG family antitoxin|nr:antitoxin VapB family protein [Candidatus Thermoplasmatota archaeon]
MVKIISIQDDVYAELTKRKDKKSFSQVIRELISETKRETTVKDLNRYWALISSEEGKMLENNVIEGRMRAKSRKIKEM